MNMLALAINAAERAPISDSLTLAGIDFLCARTKRRLMDTPQAQEEQFLSNLENLPIAVHTNEANRQHYEVPARFFELVLGARRKYSCCYYPDENTSLNEAEEHALSQTIAHAGIENGMDILELGCGWGSLSLYLAENFTASRIISVSNSASQRAFIESEAAKRGLKNLKIITADMNVFAPDQKFDRVVSVEMFEHMSNWTSLLSRVHSWLKQNGKLFIHIFTHQNRSYRFDHQDPADWIAHHFFTGGIMPAADLPHRFENLFAVEQQWTWSGTHYQRTAHDWLRNFDRNRDAISALFRDVYGRDHSLWMRRWRLFFLATAGLFGHDQGSIWQVNHYLMTKPT